jgi:hypothetical protein
MIASLRPTYRRNEFVKKGKEAYFAGVCGGEWRGLNQQRSKHKKVSDPPAVTLKLLSHQASFDIFACLLGQELPI